MSSLSKDVKLDPSRQALQAQMALRQAAYAIPLPHDDSYIKERLRECGMEEELPGETLALRRQRLREALLLQQQKLQKEQQQQKTKKVKTQKRSDDKVRDKTPTFLEKSDLRRADDRDALMTFRRWLVEDSLKRSQAGRKKIVGDFPLSQGIQLDASEVVGERPLTAFGRIPSKNNLFLMGSMGGQLTLFDGQKFQVLPELTVVSLVDRIDCIDTLNELVAVSGQGGVCIYRAREFTDVDDPVVMPHVHLSDTKYFGGSDDRMPRCALHPSSLYLATSHMTKGPCNMAIWDVEQNKLVQAQPAHAQGSYGIAWHQHGALLGTGGMDKVGRVWDVRTSRNIWALRGHSEPVLSLSFAWHRDLIATAGQDATIRVWDMRALGDPLTVIPAHTSSIVCLQWTPAHGILSASHDGTIKHWNAAFKSDFKLEGHSGKVSWAACLPELNGILSVGHDRSVRFWK